MLYIGFKDRTVYFLNSELEIYWLVVMSLKIDKKKNSLNCFYMYRIKAKKMVN